MKNQRETRYSGFDAYNCDTRFTEKQNALRAAIREFSDGEALPKSNLYCEVAPALWTLRLFPWVY